MTPQIFLIWFLSIYIFVITDFEKVSVERRLGFIFVLNVIKSMFSILQIILPWCGTRKNIYIHLGHSNKF